MDLEGEVLDGDAGVLLEDAKYLNVSLVERFGHSGIFCVAGGIHSQYELFSCFQR